LADLLIYSETEEDHKKHNYELLRIKFFLSFLIFFTYPLSASFDTFSSSEMGSMFQPSH
ncbi:hypothetical protein BDK51DRAFT_19418, partial [Blyttiomyces helicus]